ncbi:hypothetical protein FXO37_06443 [Capsicum annuum]|nr:hypothetical protein FXO37_06443 [Capsicum annuum]
MQKQNCKGIPPLVSSLDTAKKEELLNQLSVVPYDLILFAVGHHAEVNKALDRLRTYVAHQLGLIDNSRHSILWVTDFLMFEWNDSEQRLEIAFVMIFVSVYHIESKKSLVKPSSLYNSVDDISYGLSHTIDEDIDNMSFGSSPTNDNNDDDAIEFGIDSGIKRCGPNYDLRVEAFQESMRVESDEEALSELSDVDIGHDDVDSLGDSST